MPALATLTSGRTSDAGYQDNPTAFLLVGLLDVGLVVPAALVTAAGLRRGAGWARRATYGLIGWFALVPASVAAMAVVMQHCDDPQAGAANTAMLTVAAAVFLVAAGVLYRPVLRSAKAPAPVGTEMEAFVAEPPVGVEPTTYALRVRRSSRLS